MGYGYVKTITNKNSKDFIPVKERIAVFDLDGTLIGELSPTYFIGEEVAIAQSYRDAGYGVWDILEKLHPDRKPQVLDSVGASWFNKMFVRADLMPRRIKITHIRVERLQDISDADCLKEGVSKIPLVGDYTFEQAMKYTNNIKPNILQKKQSTK
mgnify:CR=1 FL=1